MISTINIKLFTFYLIILFLFGILFCICFSKEYMADEEDYFSYLKYTYPHWFEAENYIAKSFARPTTNYASSVGGKFYAHSCVLLKENIVDHSLVYQYIICDRGIDKCYYFYRLASSDNAINIYYVSTQFGDAALAVCLEFIARLVDVGGDPTLILVDEFPDFISSVPQS